MKKLFAVILSVCLLMGACAAAFAEDAPEAEVLKKHFDLGDLGDEDLEDIVAELLYCEAFDDDEYDDLQIALWIADALESGEIAVDEIVLIAAALAYYDANPEGEDEDVEAVLKLLGHLIEDKDTYELYEKDIKNFRKNLRSEEYGDMNALLQDVILEEIMDNEDTTDLQVLLQIIHFFFTDEYLQWDNARALVLLAMVDLLDDDSNADLEHLDAYARAALDDGAYAKFIETLKNVYDFLTNGEYDDIDDILLQLALINFLDDEYIADYEMVLEIFSAAIAGNADAFTGLLLAALINDYYDNYDEEDVNVILEYIKEFEKASDDGYGLYEKANNIMDQLRFFEQVDNA